ncbi:transcriptional regulator, partial [Enterococcus faecium]|nr:transcriptional regulator [Enterococcus faecium]MBT1041795.1 transcriptional regulator [Enterococcus faecium]MBT1056368.1 transcriptional regulator [Enterococcus faecium]
QKNTLADNVIAAIQTAICNKRVISIQYPASGGQEPESRMIEPVLLQSFK